MDAQINNIDTFFTESIDTREFSKYGRKLLQKFTLMYLKENDRKDNKEVQAAYFWLNTFLDVIDPKSED